MLQHERHTFECNWYIKGDVVIEKFQAILSCKPIIEDFSDVITNLIKYKAVKSFPFELVRSKIFPILNATINKNWGQR